jgi:hypothetical protein
MNLEWYKRCQVSFSTGHYPGLPYAVTVLSFSLGFPPKTSLYIFQKYHAEIEPDFKNTREERAASERGARQNEPWDGDDDYNGAPSLLSPTEAAYCTVVYRSSLAL